MAKYSLGWVRQKPDHRDIIFKTPKYITEVLPSKMMLKTPSVLNQGDLGSCGPNSTSSMIRYDNIITNKNVPDPSRLFIYYNTRLLMGTVNQDSGVENRTMLKALNKYGFVFEQGQYVYDIRNYKKKPGNIAYKNAKSKIIKNYAAIPQVLSQMKACIGSAIKPFLFGFEVFNQIFNAPNGVLQMPRRFDSPVGGHDVTMVGYDDEAMFNGWSQPGGFKFLNSWGAGWGNQGFGWIPYAYAINQNLAGDFWVINAVP